MIFGRISRAACLGTALFLVLPAVVRVTALPQAPQDTSQTATLSGTVKNGDQKTIPGASVTLRNSSGSVGIQTHSDPIGRFKFTGQAPGSYVIHAESDAWGSSTRPIFLKAGETTVVDLALGHQPFEKTAQYFDEPTFTVAGVSESTGAGVHASDATTRNAEKLAKETASLSPGLAGRAKTETQRPTLPNDATELRTLIAQNDQAQLHNQLGHIEERSGQALDAVKEFQRASEMDPSENNLFDWATELLLHRAAEPATEVFVKGIRLYPESVRMLTGLAVAEYASGNFSVAVDRLAQAADLEPSNPLPYTFLGRMQNAEVKRSPKALEKLARFHDLRPNDPQANLYYAVALWSQPGATANSTTIVHVEQLARTAITIDPGFAPAYLQLGIVQASENQFAQAASTLEKAAALDPTLEEAHYRLAQVYRRLGNEAKAKLEFDAYQRLSQSAEEDAKRQRKTVQQFIYELGTSTNHQNSH